MSNRVQIPFGFQYPATVSGSTVLEPVVSAAVTITNRNGGAPATVYVAETGTATIASVVTDSSGNVPGWLAEGSYLIVVSASGSFTGASIAWEAVRGDGVGNIAAGAVNMTTLATPVVQSLVPPGAIIASASAATPSGYLPCDGSVYATASYPALSSALGTTWNTGGEGAGNFRVPNTQGRVLMNSGTATGAPGATSHALASIGGEQTHVTTINEMPAHNHSVGYAGNGFAIAAGGDGSVAGSTGFTGGGQAHNNLQPFATINHFVKT